MFPYSNLNRNNVFYKNNAINCHHSKAKGMCPFDNDNNNNIKKFLIDKNTIKTNDVKKGYNNWRFL